MTEDYPTLAIISSVTKVPLEILEKFKRDYPSLLLRVRDGNDKIIVAYLKIQDIEDENIFNASMEKIGIAVSTLRDLTTNLEVMQECLYGKSDCLYVMTDGKKVRKCQMLEKTPKGKTVETFCWVCPSEHPYWREEWQEFNQAMALPGL